MEQCRCAVLQLQSASLVGAPLISAPATLSLTPPSLSEYGCITNTRTFAETAALYQTDMTSVFSGGLVYEYSEEGNNFGLVTISGSTVTPVGSQFSDLQQQMTSTSNPSGNGNYSTSGVVQSCPGQSDNWNTSPFTGSALPAMPSGALQYFQKGAGTGPGLAGSGSQQASGGSSGTASANAGAATTTYGSGAAGASSTSTKSSAASPQIMVHSYDALLVSVGAAVLAALGSSFMLFR